MNIIDIILNFQANVELNVPREHHKFILGKGGKTLQTLELQTATKITMPRDGSDTIRIVGTKEGVDSARHEIQIISDEQVSCREIISVGWSELKKRRFGSYLGGLTQLCKVQLQSETELSTHWHFQAPL